jgi:uncharacterized membrane protein
MNKISVTESWKYGWGVFKKNWQILIYATAVPFLIGTVMSEAFQVDDLKKVDIKNLYPLGLLALYYVLKYLLQVLFNLGQTRITLDAAFGGESKAPKYFDLFNSQGIYLRFLGVSLLYTLAVLGGFILLIIPGIYIALRYYFAPILVIDKKMGIGEAFATSKEMTKGIKWQLLGFTIVSAVFVLLGLIALGIGIVATYIIYKIAFVHLYRKLSDGLGVETSGGQLVMEEVETVSQEQELAQKDSQKDSENM